ncbi:MAG TPA: hypothetical protein VMB72_14720 [Acidimicrobiales bacterium]|nr:hypothetical protein [Acidimicrobiales bacterium]
MRGTKEFGSLGHLATRFFGALWPGGPRRADETWARRWLLGGELELWDRMSGPDRRHAVGVARGTIELLGDGDDPERAVVASALLHDVGKVESGLGTMARAVVTAAGLVVGRSRLIEAPGSGGREPRWHRRTRQYLTHDLLGAELLTRAGSDPLTVAWARQHHLPSSAWTVDARVAGALKAADDD